MVWISRHSTFIFGPFWFALLVFSLAQFDGHSNLNSVVFLYPFFSQLYKLIIGQGVVLVDQVDQVADNGPHSGVLNDLSSLRQNQDLTELLVEGVSSD